ncbi:TYPE IV PREPILIN PEPTIDASE [Wolinella succinogenes]|uniref:TYPE IV PREPILIN PEPTIDASE n=1 Tax=Wolinella succinogenes (strain ATCC 29543 / DSM 1740 / CCUG 13145 / JCM 31913 / LMG 7466 / NCTC 11488 / FDC 602W) TaxID=273121 RepID=Q7M9U4_WOLSU|nr:TYPE IV PREPILIN PEPTIDASE [Wolinella succinogenes]
MAIVRIPEDRSVCFPASHCPHCQKPLRFWHNIPLLSYLFLGGRCAFCQAKISPLYPLVELLSAFLGLAVVMREGFVWPALALGVSFGLLLALSVIDIKTQKVPDSLNFIALLAALAYGASLESLEAAFIIAGALTLLRFGLSWILHQEAMGEGDIILAATMGAILGVKLALVAVFVAALLALPVMLLLSKKDSKIAFIPFLSLGLWIVYGGQDWILSYLESWYG